ncbi:MAG TPA: DEAD/DEAH box helicase, partial [Armatimonadota bacterium]|nr:DEAD/DEAH box helicase [Armatimonadota bacterium]
MDVSTFLARIQQQHFFQDQVVHVQELPARDPVYADVPGGLHPAVLDALYLQGIECLYSHQAAAINQVRQGNNVVIVTGTASGKTLCYNIPVVETLANDALATALYLFPTKALAQDQLRGIGKFNLEEQGVHFLAGTYDGDTPQNLRRKLRDGGNVILTNPDMLHQGILPQHARWNRFFTNLKYIVIDEVHAYRGVFGSHLANVMRRLLRICRHYGAHPQFICCSATIDNPQAHAERITGQPMVLVDNDGSPRGPTQFIMWNPPPLETAAHGTM